LRDEFIAVPNVTVTGLAWLVGVGLSSILFPPDLTLGAGGAPLNKAGLDVALFEATSFLEVPPNVGFLGEIERDTDLDFSRLSLQEAAESAAEETLAGSSSPERTDLAADALVGASRRDLADSR
jgi:hypothetical protein